jgi:membrane-bound lytic murein transglycosylase D
MMRAPERLSIGLLAAALVGCVPPERERQPATDSGVARNTGVSWNIPIERNAEVERWLEYYTTEGRESFEISLARGGRYEALMREILEREGVPGDLVYISLIESGFQITAHSRARALGLWQFVPATARIYGLEVSRWVDERLDPIASTYAAGDYLADLHREFGDWYLALAAYNAGPGRINAAIRRAGTRDFWTLAESGLLEWETRAYVPKLIAVALIAKEPHEYGVRVRPEPIATSSDYSYVEDATSLDVVAHAVGAPLDRILALNPHLVRGITPPGRRYPVRLPVGTPLLFAENYAAMPPEQRVRSVLHVVRRGDTLSEIAELYGTTPSAIREANDGLDPRGLRAGQRLVVPEARNVPGLTG